MTYLLLLPPDEARQTLRVFDDKLGVPDIPRKSREDATFFGTTGYPNSGAWPLVGNLHFFSHLNGWCCRMLLMRDWHMVWVCSLSWEVLEMGCMHWQFNMYECWWDHLLMDVLGCNLTGIVVGYYTLKYLDLPFTPWLWDSRQTAKPEQESPTTLTKILDLVRPSCLDKP